MNFGLKHLDQIIDHKEENPDEMAIRIHHVLMKEYGWIPFEEFMNLPITTTIDLLMELKKDNDKEKSEMEKMKHKGRGRV
jgi:hypothetical protein